MMYADESITEMELKKLHMGTLVFGWDSMDEVAHLLGQALDASASPSGEFYGDHTLQSDDRVIDSHECEAEGFHDDRNTSRPS